MLKHERVPEIEEIIVQGVESGEITPFTTELFDRLRPFSYGGIPASILLFIPERNRTSLSDSAKLLSLAFPDSRLVYAEIESLRAKGQTINEPTTFYVETSDLNMGDCVIEPATGLIYKKSFFESLEKPKVLKIFPRASLLELEDVQTILSEDIELIKSSCLLSLPRIEEIVVRSEEPLTVVHKAFLQSEIKKLKAAIDYDGLCKERDDEIAMMYKNPLALDKKYGIVRDKYGNALSKHGKRNSALQTSAHFDELTQDLDEYNRQRFHAGVKLDRLEDDKRIKRTSRQRLSEIKRNPTKDVYLDR